MRLKFLCLALSLATAPLLSAETVHQSIEAEDGQGGTGNGASRDNGSLEIQEVDGATLARVVPTFNQWAYVSYWIGIPTPAGKATVRLHVYNTEDITAKFVVYIKVEEGQKMIGEIAVPPDAPKNAFVDINLPVELTEDWSGIILKKASKESDPGPWIDNIKVIVE